MEGKVAQSLNQEQPMPSGPHDATVKAVAGAAAHEACVSPLKEATATKCQPVLTQRQACPAWPDFWLLERDQKSDFKI